MAGCRKLDAYWSPGAGARLSAGFSASERGGGVAVAWVPVPAAAACRGLIPNGKTSKKKRFQTGDEVAVNRDYLGPI